MHSRQKEYETHVQYCDNAEFESWIFVSEIWDEKGQLIKLSLEV